MRAIWKGHISFALVTIPISLFSATKRNELSFHYLHKKDMSPVSYKRFCDTEDTEVPWDEITKGYEYEKGQYIEITDEDIERADVELTKTIQIMEFVQEDEIDPVYFDKPYYLEPQKGGERAYALMREALAQAKKGRLHILDAMAQTLSQARAEMSPFAPRIITFSAICVLRPGKP